MASARDPRRRAVVLLELDADRGLLVPSERAEEARGSLQVALQRLSVASWNVTCLAQADPGHLGMLIVDGVLARDIVLEDSISTELVGAAIVAELAGGVPPVRRSTGISVRPPPAPARRGGV